jgi:ketosteroid isomerase-like protein
MKKKFVHSAMHPNEKLIHDFYTAFQQRQYLPMQQSYHPEAKFHDPVFQDLSSEEVRAMWQMLLTSAKDLTVTFSTVQADDHRGSCQWEAWYTFSRTGRKVHNIVQAQFSFRDGKIIQHRDSFDLWRWSRQALGLSGILLGWSPLVKNKIRRMAQAGLKKFMQPAPLQR